MLIEFTDVSFTHSKRTPFATQALDKLNIRITEGDWLVVMGPTGAGKSTFLQHMNALLKPESGEIKLHGHNIHASRELRREARQKVGLVFQYPEHQLFGNTVWEEVSYGLINFGCPEALLAGKVKQAMEMVGLDFEKYKGRQPYQLSGGEKRRVVLAGVLACQPEIIALDEPTAGLDAAGRQILIRTIADLNRKHNITVIWVTHEISEISHLAKRLVIMDRGKIVLDNEIRKGLESSLVEDLGLDIPLPLQTARLLRKKGCQIQGSPVTLEEIKTEILKLGQ